MIKDSGERRQFDTGAVRDIQEGKGRCDLLPLDVLSDIYLIKLPHEGRWQVLSNIDSFIDTTNVDFLIEALENFIWCDGAYKYNWQKGIPTHCYIDSAVRHYLKWLRGDDDEAHDRAFVWNILCCIWTCKHKPELNDYFKWDDESEEIPV